METGYPLHTNFRPSKFYVKAGLGFVPLDEIIDSYDFSAELPTDDDIEHTRINQEFLDTIDMIAKKHLNNKERCIYYLVIHEKKRTSDIATILNYNGWRTTQNSIDRVFKILLLYYEFERINKEDLEFEITRNFSKIEIKVIKLLETRFTIHQISKKLGRKFHYTKTHCLIKNILSRLDDTGGCCRQFHNFLIEIRRYKDSCNFNEVNDKIRFLEEQNER